MKFSFRFIRGWTGDVFKNIHPAVFMTVCAVIILKAQLLAGDALVISSSIVGLAAICLARRRFIRMTKRLRFMLLAIAILFAWQTPGTLIWSSLDWAPTIEGLQLASEHCLHIMILAALLSVLLEYLSPEAWINGICILASPLRLFSFQPQCFAMRLLLVLRYVEEGSAMRWQNVLSQLPTNALPAYRCEWSLQPLRGCDRLMLAVLGCVIVVWSVG